MKHAVLVQLVRGMQRKEKGFLYLDTHAGRGAYDLAAADHGDTLERKPEHPDGIGRLLGEKTDAQNNPSVDATQETDPLREYIQLVRAFDRRCGNLEPDVLRIYPGSPSLVRALMRPQDRMALCEKHPDEFASLRGKFQREPRVSVHEIDGYTAIRAMLPPPEKRTLVLIDPPFEAQDEYEAITRALREGLRRMPAATFAVWYPLTERARADDFLNRLAMLGPPPTFAAELTIAGETSSLKMRGCGMAVINPPWQIDQTLAPMLDTLYQSLAQSPGGKATLDWIVRE
ncbi:23S rRNA (adenine(2030)-N(6))-methyltransferase RlmJ [Ereboglobus luteus]|nr:23S rRNA (adenine(2030)-N(6))-methyltransferase RlmJ [Ereboglobus luteus]